MAGTIIYTAYQSYPISEIVLPTLGFTGQSTLYTSDVLYPTMDNAYEERCEDQPQTHPWNE